MRSRRTTDLTRSNSGYFEELNHGVQRRYRGKGPFVDGHYLAFAFYIKPNFVAILLAFENFISAGPCPGRKVGQRAWIGCYGFYNLSDFNFFDTLAYLDNRHGAGQSFQIK